LDLVREAAVELDESFLHDAAELRLPILAQLFFHAFDVQLPSGSELLMEQFSCCTTKSFLKAALVP